MCKCANELHHSSCANELYHPGEKVKTKENFLRSSLIIPFILICIFSLLKLLRLLKKNRTFGYQFQIITKTKKKSSKKNLQKTS